MMNNAMDRPVISDTMEEDKTAAGFLPARIGFPLKKVKIIRYLLLLSVIILQIFPKEIDFRSMVILLTGLYTFHILFYSYCAATKQDHFFNSMIFITSDLVMTAAFTLFLDFFLLLPFISLANGRACNGKTEESRYFSLRGTSDSPDNGRICFTG